MDTNHPNGLLSAQRVAGLPAGVEWIMRRRFLPALASVLMVAQTGASSALDLQSHRALYRMVLSRSRPSVDVVAADGAMMYRIARGCDGWTVENRTILSLLYSNDTEADTVWSFASWESADGLKFRFHARFEQDGRTIEKLEGEAVLPSAGAAGTARFTEPPEIEVRLPQGTIFPTEHIRQMIAAAEKGHGSLSRVVFDGASLENPYLVNALFGPLPLASAEELARAAGLPMQPAWWTRLAFFPTEGIEPAPEFEVGARYRADGIADDILQTFGNFSLDVRLTKIELLPPPDC